MTSCRCVVDVRCPGAWRWAHQPSLQPPPFHDSCLDKSAVNGAPSTPLHSAPHFTDTIHYLRPHSYHYHTVNCTPGRLGAVTTSLVLDCFDRASGLFLPLLLQQPPRSCLNCKRIPFHHGAHSLPSPSRAYAASAPSRRQLRAVFTAPVEQSGRPTRPSPRANEPTV